MPTMSSRTTTPISWADMSDDDDSVGNLSWNMIPLIEQRKMSAQISRLENQIKKFEVSKPLSNNQSVIHIHGNHFGQHVGPHFVEIREQLFKNAENNFVFRKDIVRITATVVSTKKNGQKVRFTGKDIVEYLSEEGLVSGAIFDSSGNEKFQLLRVSSSLKKNEKFEPLKPIERPNMHPTWAEQVVLPKAASVEKVEVSTEISASVVKAFLSDLVNTPIDSLPKVMKDLREIEAVLGTTLTELKEKRDVFLAAMQAGENEPV